MAKATQERYSRKKTTTASQTNTERNSHYKSETKKQQEAKNTKVNVTDRNSHYNSETYKKNNPKVETKVEPKVETKVEPKVESKIEKKQSKTSTERNSHYDSSKIYNKINETVKKEPLQLDQESFNTWMDTATGRQGTQREKQEPGDQKLMKMAGNIVGGMVNTGFKGYDLLKEFASEQMIKGYESNRDNLLGAGYTNEQIDELIQKERDKFDINDEDNWSNLIDKQIEKNRETIYNDTNAVEKFALQTVESAGQFGAHMLLAMATGGSSLVTMGLQAGTDKAYQNLQEGYDVNTAIGNGAMTGIMTALVEKLPVDNFGKLVTSPLSQFSLGAIASQMVSEGAEEGLEYLIEPQIDRIMLGKEAEYNAGDLFMSIALGMSSGGLVGTVGNAIPIINTRKQFNQLKADVKTLTEYKNTNQLTEEESIAVNSALQLANQALNKFESTSVLKNAVQYESDKVKDLSAREVMENFQKFLQPQIDQDVKLNQEQQAVNSILETSQKVLAQKGIQMDALQYSKLDNDAKAEVDKIQSFANSLNTNVVFNSDLVAENGQVIDGMYIPEVGIVINPNGKRKAMSTFVHELTHGTESSQYYAPLKKLIIDSNGDYAKQVQDIKNAYKTVTDLSTEGATKEYVAIKTQDMLGNEQFVDKLVKYNTSLANRIYEGIKQIVSLTNTEQEIEYNFMKAFREYGIDTNQTQMQYSQGLSSDDLSEIDDLLLDFSDEELFGMSDEEFDKLIGYNDLQRKPKYKLKENYHPKNIEYKQYNELANQLNDLDKIEDMQSLEEYVEKYYTNKHIPIDVRSALNQLLEEGYDEDLLFDFKWEEERKYKYKIEDYERAGKKLQERFDALNSPLAFDNNGRWLSSQQREYFKNVNIYSRDEYGCLKTFYHGTSDGGHTVFELGEKKNGRALGDGFYFSDAKRLAEEYMIDYKTKTAKNPQLYEVYLKMENTLSNDTYDGELADKALEIYRKYENPDGKYGSPHYYYVESKLSSANGVIDYFKYLSEKNNIPFGELLKEYGYDSINYFNEYVVFDSEQIKNVDNKKPTSNPDIRYSIGLTPQELNESRKYEREKASLLKELQDFGVTKVDSNYETLYNEAISNVLKTGEVRPELYEEIKKETWDRMVDIQENPLNENAKQIREFIRNNPINIQSFNKGDFAGKEEWNEWRKQNFGIFRFSKEKGASIDTIYDEFNNMFSGLVDTSITSSYDQLMELKRVVDLVGEEGTEVHVSEYGMDKETFNTFFDEKMNDFIDDVKTHENLKKFEDSIKLDTNVDVSNVEMEHLLDGKLTDTEYEKFLKLQDKMVDGASTWIPNYNIIRNKYTEFSEKNFAQALFENLINGNVSDETRQALKNDVLYKFFGGDEASYNENPVAKNRLNEFLNDSIKNFIADAQYKSNKQYMRSIATKVNNLLRGYTDGVDNVQFNNKYEQQEALKRITDMIKANRKERMGSLKEIVSALPIEGQDKVNRLRTLEQNLDLIAGGKGELRTMLREALEMPRYNAQTEYARNLDKYNDVIADIIKNDLIREGTKESKAVQWIMETHKENGEEYDSYKLREDFDYTMANGKKAYENIESASKKLRTAYDEIFNTINTQRYSIYGDVELENSIETQKLEAKVRQQERLIEDYEQMLAKSPTAQLQSAYDSALIELKKLQNQLDVKKQSDASGDSIRRQKLQYRKNYAHHIIKRKGILGTIVEGVRAIPTRLSGISDYAKPRTAYAGFFNKQAENSKNYEADAIAGFASYIKDASKVIAYDPLIDYYRTFNSDLRAMAKDTEMSKFVNYLDDYANNLAGKTEDFDRAVRKNVDKSVSVIKKLNQRVKSNALLFNFRTAFTQVYNIPNGVGVLSKNGGVETSKDFVKGALDYFTTFTSDSTVREQSPFLKARFFDTDTGKQGIGATMDDIQNFMLTKGDEISTKLIWNVAYQQGLRKGVEDPIFYADDLTRRSVGGRSVGEVPLLLQSEIVNLFAPFQIETTNAFINTLDMVKDKNALPALLAMLIANWLFNEMSDELFKDRILFDPIDVIAEGIENEESFGDTAFRMGGEILGNMPFGSFIPTLFGLDSTETEKIFGDSDPSRYGIGNMGLSIIGSAIKDVKDGNYLDAISDVIANYGLPRGGKQLQRTIEALQTNGMLPQFENGQLVQEPIYYTGSGKVGFVTNPDAIMDSPENFFDFAKQVMFGKWAGKEAQEYIEGGFKSMGKTQTNMFDALNEEMSTSDSYNMAEEVYEAKKNMTGEDGKLQFIEYLNSGEFTPEQRNEIYDTYYGDNPLTVRINDFAKGINLDAEQTFKVKDILSTTQPLKDSNDKTITHSRALSVRKQLDELGLYDDMVKFIQENKLQNKDMNLTNGVVAMSNSEFQSKYKEIFGESYEAQTDDSLYDAYASTFGKSSGKGSTSKKTSSKTNSPTTENNVFSMEEQKAKIDSILAKVYGGTSSTTSAYNKINTILNKVKSSKTKSTINIKSKYSKLIKDYLKNHPEDAHLFS